MQAAAGQDQKQTARWPAFWPWLATTALLAIFAAALAYHVETRPPIVVEVAGPVPLAEAPSEALLAAAAFMRQEIGDREEALREALDKPAEAVCEPGTEPDTAARELLLNAEAATIASWRALLPTGTSTPPNIAAEAPSQEEQPVRRRILAPAD
ncbi:MAG: hypothetical protein AAF713_09425 [Pseudomonadota bacterium]